MPDTYYIQGERITLGSELGSGGAAIVYMGMGRYNDSALKIWKPFPSPVEKDLTVKKARYAISLALPSHVYKPLDIITADKKGTEAVGIRMLLYPTGYLPINDLSIVDTWRAYDLTQLDVGKIFLNLYDLFVALHEKGVCLADPNPMNFFFHPRTHEVLAGDVDAFQFGPDMPATSGHVEYIAPSRYTSLPIGLQPARSDLLPDQDAEYLPDHDWWSYIVNLIRSLMRTHPFREGANPGISVTDRVLLGEHIFDNPPPIRTIFPLKSLSNDVLSYFLGVVRTKRASRPPRALISALADPSRWKVCTKHTPHVTYAVERSECPHCAKDKSLPAITAVVIGAIAGYILRQMYKPPTKRQLVFAGAIEIPVGNAVEHLLCTIARDTSNNLVATLHGPRGVKTESVLPARFRPGQRYGVNAKYIGIVEDKQFMLFTHEGRKVSEFTTEVYARVPVATFSAQEPIWLQGAALTFGKEFYGKLLPQSSLNLTFGNTWFEADQHADLMVGFTHWPHGYEWYTLQRYVRHPLNLQLNRDHILVEWRVVFAQNHFAILRRIQNKHAQERVYLNVFTVNGSQLYETLLPLETNIAALALQQDGSTYIPTEQGVMSIDPHGKNLHMVGTENVPPTVRLVIVNNSIVVVDDDSSIFVIRSN